jgi:mRNA-degrading endonuclease RelE of RelBE toxin-antitoxin system
MKKIPRNYQVAIHDKVDQLVDFPGTNDALDIKKLSNHDYDYRMRVGRYRVMFDFQEKIKIIAIQEVKKRDERTY